MLKNYLKIAFRNIVKGKFFYGINILGLSIAIASAIIIYLYQDYERSYDRFHEDYERIYRVTVDVMKDGVLELQDAELYRPAGPLLKEKLPEIEDFVRFVRSETVFLNENGKEFAESKVLFADQSFFNFFNYELISGSRENDLSKPNQMVLTESAALRYFNSLDVVGKTISFNDAGQNEIFDITAVISNSPSNTHLKFEILVSLETQRKWEWSSHLFESWNGNNDYTYVKIAEGSDINEIVRKSNDVFKEVHDKENSDVERLNFDAIADIHLYSKKTYEPEANGDYQAVNVVVFAGILILILAWVNYINLSTAQSLNRAHEVGVKKVIGSTRLQLIIQFILESFIIILIAAIVAFTLVQILYPLLQSLSILNFEINLLSGNVILFVFTIILISVFLSGLYPAIVISGFKPAEVLKGKSGTGKKGKKLRKSLVIVQFSLSGILIGLSIMMHSQINYVINKNMGMDKDNIIVVNVPSLTRDSSFVVAKNKFRNDLLQSNSISDVAFAGTVPGTGYEELSSSTGIHIYEKPSEASRITYYNHSADENYLPLMKIKIVEGRNFTEDEPGDRVMIINEKAAEMLGFENPEEAIGQKLNWRESTIVGVVENYHHHSPKIDYEPMIYWYSRSNVYKIAIKYAGNDPKVALEEIQDTWVENFPNSAFDYFFLDEKFGNQYNADLRLGLLFSLFTVISILIAIVGLLGLVAYNTTLKTKEIGIRKILGASIPGLIQWLLLDFIKLVIISVIFAIPTVYLLSEAWLQNYAFRIENNPFIGVIAGLILIIISVISGVAQVSRSANANPVDTLRYE